MVLRQMKIRFALARVIAIVRHHRREGEMTINAKHGFIVFLL